MDITQSLESLGIDPISPDNPTGEDIRYEDSFSEVEAEFQRLSAVDTDRSAAKWSQVVEPSITILKDQSKDLRIASWLIVGCFFDYGMVGLHAGMKLLENLMDNFWDGIYPSADKGRAAAIEFMATYLAGSSDEPGGQIEWKSRDSLDNFREFLKGRPKMQTLEPRLAEFEKEYEALDQLKATLKSLKTKIYEKFPPDRLPSFSSPLAVIEKLQMNYKAELDKARQLADQGAPKPQASPAPVTNTPSDSPAPAAKSTASSAPSLNLREDGNRDSVLPQLLPLAHFLLRLDPSDALGYRLKRASVFGPITELPVITEGNMTFIPGDIPTSMSASLESMSKGTNPMNLLEQAEGIVSEAPFWFDLQYYIAGAMRSLGVQYEAAREAIISEFKQLLSRVPGIEKFEFNNNIPFANADTQEWIKSEVMNFGKSSGSGGSTPVPSGGSKVAEDFAKAQELSRSNKLGEAFQIMEAGLRSSGSQRERFLYQSSLAQLASENKKHQTALHILQGLVKEIETYKLADWEPDICMPVLENTYRLLKRDKDKEEEAARIFGIICQISPSNAFGLD